MWDLPNDGFIRLFNHVALPSIKHTFLFPISPHHVVGAHLPDSQPDVMARILSPRSQKQPSDFLILDWHRPSNSNVQNA